MIAVRIAHGLTRRELADRLGISEAVVSRDERNEYHGITVERAQRIVDALQEWVTTTIDEGWIEQGTCAGRHHSNPRKVGTRPIVTPGHALGTLWARSGHALGTLWARSGHALGTLWARSGHALGTLWARSGHALGTLWARSGHLLGTLWARVSLEGTLVWMLGQPRAIDGLPASQTTSAPRRSESCGAC